MHRLTPLAAAFLVLAGHATAEERPVPAANRSALAITVYNDGQALVRDTRRFDLDGGLNTIAFKDVAATIRAETASLKSVSGTPLRVLEQNYEFDLLSPASLLRKYVGKEITVLRVNPATGAETKEAAMVLANNDGVVLRYADRIESGAAGRLAYSAVPANLRDRPTLTMTLQADRKGPQEAELTYLANDVRWKADYVANVARDGRSMQLNGLVTLTNRSGADFENANLQLVAGTLNRVREEARFNQFKAKRAEMALAAAPDMAEEKLGDYHLYTLGRPTTVLNNQTKQVALLAADDVPVTKEYVLQQPGQFWWYQGVHPEVRTGLKPSVFLRFENKGNLGLPMPAGVVRVYAKDSRGGAQFVGEDAIGHTAKGEKIALRLGESFDLTADRVQTDYKSLSPRSSQSSYRIEIRNADKEPVTVLVREPLHGDWTITSETSKHLKESAGTAVWALKVPGEGAATLEYTAIVKW